MSSPLLLPGAKARVRGCWSGRGSGEELDPLLVPMGMPRPREAVQSARGHPASRAGPSQSRQEASAHTAALRLHQAPGPARAMNWLPWSWPPTKGCPAGMAGMGGGQPGLLQSVHARAQHQPTVLYFPGTFGDSAPWRPHAGSQGHFLDVCLLCRAPRALLAPYVLRA